MSCYYTTIMYVDFGSYEYGSLNSFSVHISCVMIHCLSTMLIKLKETNWGSFVDRDNHMDMKLIPLFSVGVIIHPCPNFIDSQANPLLRI